MDRLRPHNTVLQTSRLRLRPLTEDDWDILLRWHNDPEVLHFSEGADVGGYSLEEVQDIYRDVSAHAFCFMIEHEGQPIGECWLQRMNVERILTQHPDEKLWRIDLMIGEKQLWGRGLGTEAICLLTDFGFGEQEADRIYGCFVADYNLRSRQAFRKVGYVISGVSPEKPGAKMRFSYDLCLARDKYLGRPHPPRVLNMAETAIFPDIWQPLKGLAEVVTAPADAQVLADCLPDFDAYFATLHARLTADMIRRAPRLKVVTTPSTGLDHLDLDAMAEHGIALLSLKDDTEFLDSITATAEMAWGLLLAVARKLPWSFAAAQRGEWARDRFRGTQLSGKTLGLLGYGRLGRIVAEYGKAFRMNVLACDIKPVSPASGVQMVDFDTLLRESDVLSIHIHLTDENRCLLNAAAFARMKPGAILLNTSRGAIIDEAALLEALQGGPLVGAGLDVIEGEWHDDLADHPLIRYAATHKNLVISPHTGGVTTESQRMTIAHMVRKLRQYLEDLE